MGESGKEQEMSFWDHLDELRGTIFRSLLAELDHQRKFLAGVRAKLSNEKFVAHAPEAVIANERKKEADALARIEALEASLKAL